MCEECEELILEIQATREEIGELRLDISALLRWIAILIAIIKRTRRNLKTVLERAGAEAEAGCPKLRWTFLKGATEAAQAIIRPLK